MPRRTHRPTLPEWQWSRAFQSQQDQSLPAAPQPAPAVPQRPQLPLAVWQRIRPFLSPSNRLRATIAIKGLVDVGALDSNIQAVGQLEIQRRTDIGWIVIRHKAPPRELAPARPAVAQPSQAQLLGQIHDMRLEALWMSGALTDDEYFALRQAA